MGRSKGFVASVEAEKAGASRAGEWNGEVDSTIGGGNINLWQVEAAHLIAIGQHVCSNARWQ